MAELDQYLTRVGAADLAGVSEATIRGAIARGQLEVADSGDGRVSLLRRSDVEQWAGQERAGPGRPRGSRSHE